MVSPYDGGEADKVVEREERTRKKFEDAYKSGYGSVVFFEDQERIKQYSSKSPDFATVGLSMVQARRMLMISCFPSGPKTPRGSRNT